MRNRGYGLSFWLLGIMIASGCGQDEATYRVFVSFPDQQALTTADELRIYAIVPEMPVDDCADLLSADAFPGDDGYRIETQLTIPTSSSGSDLTLDSVGSGRRLFFAEARTQSIALLFGCTERPAGQEDRTEVLILLN